MTEVAERLAAVLRERTESLVAAWLFGSHARGDAGPTSDVDVAVLYDEPPPPTLDGLAVELQGSLEAAVRAPVDLVVLNEASRRARGALRRAHSADRRPGGAARACRVDQSRSSFGWRRRRSDSATNPTITAYQSVANRVSSIAPVAPA